jgi:low affinity Fe/Cu permease
MDARFNRIAAVITQLTGTWQACVIALILVLSWFVGGFFVGFLNTSYQLFINSGTTIITFLMVFIIQSAQNRDAAALHLKLDELLQATQGAHNEAMRAEQKTQAEIREAHDKLMRDVES